MPNNYLFVCGCARSGTTALARALNGHPEIIVGNERFIRRFNQTGFLGRELFEQERFLAVKKGDDSKNRPLGRHYDGVAEKFATARYVGDKIPNLYKGIGMLRVNFPGCKIISIVRNVIDVAASFQTRMLTGQRWPEKRDGFQAVLDWNESITRIDDAEGPDQLVVLYEHLFVRGIGWDRIGAFLGVNMPTPPMRDSAPSGPSVLTIEQKEFILLEAKLKRYRALVKMVDATMPNAVSRRTADGAPMDDLSDDD